jgi:hypothetical protein
VRLVRLDVWRCPECGQLYEVGKVTPHDTACRGAWGEVPLEPVAVGRYLRLGGLS